MLCIQCRLVTVPEDSQFCAKCDFTLDQMLVHESGHALMAVVHDIECPGICYERGAGKFCTPGRSPNPPEQWAYALAAGGVAAERVIYGPDHNSGGAAGDKTIFNRVNAPSFD